MRFSTLAMTARASSGVKESDSVAEESGGRRDEAETLEIEFFDLQEDAKEGAQKLDVRLALAGKIGGPGFQVVESRAGLGNGRSGIGRKEALAVGARFGFHLRHTRAGLKSVI